MKAGLPVPDYRVAPVPPHSRHLQLLLAVGALALTASGWVWFAMCFTATAPAWWNSLWVFVAAFGLALVLAVASFFTRGSALAIVAAVAAVAWSGLSLAVVLILAVP